MYLALFVFLRIRVVREIVVFLEFIDFIFRFERAGYDFFGWRHRCRSEAALQGRCDLQSGSAIFSASA